MKLLAPALVALGLCACGPSTPKPPPGPSVDTSCGLDCDAQTHYGLLIGTCYEYAQGTEAATPPDLGVTVEPVETLEGGVQVLPLVYRQGGQVRMTDFFALPDQKLQLVRRSFLPGESVTYRDGEGNIVGVTWLARNAVNTENFASTATADVVSAGAPAQEATNYTVVLAPASDSERAVPLQTFETAAQMVFTESPDHGADSRRIFVPGQGFISFSSRLRPASAASGTSTVYRLQAVRQLGENPDFNSCGQTP